MRRRGLVGAAVLAAALALPQVAAAAFLGPLGTLASPGSGVAQSGYSWVSESANGTVARVDLGGNVVSRYAVGASPSGVATGPNGTVWVAVQGAKKLVWFDATAPEPTAHDVSTAAASDCGPVAIADGQNGKMYFSLPNVGSCADPSSIGFVASTGLGAPTAVVNRGQAFDLIESSGFLYVPDFEGDVVRRLAKDDTLTVSSTVAVPPGGSPNGIARDGSNNIWTTLYSAGAAAKFPATQDGGSAVVYAPSGGTLTHPIGVAQGPDGAMYLAGNGSANIARVDAAGAYSFFPAPAGAQPLRAAPGGNSRLVFTDAAQPRLLILADGAPSVGASTGTAPTATTATLEATADSRGNDTQVTIDYGPTSDYGQSAGPFTVPAGLNIPGVRADVTGLSPSTTYHVRARATNVRGSASDPLEGTFTTPAATLTPGTPAPPLVAIPLLPAKVVAAFKLKGKFTLFTKLRLTALGGKETIRVRCKGKGCPFKSRSPRAKAGTLNLDKLFKKRKLRKGAVVTITITKPASTGRHVSFTTRLRKKPKIKRACLAPGASKPTVCP